MTCPECKGCGFLYGGLLHDPAIVRCVCNGGPPQPWRDLADDSESARWRILAREDVEAADLDVFFKRRRWKGKRDWWEES